MKRLLLGLLILASCTRATTPPVEIVQDPAIGATPIRTVAVAPALASGAEVGEGGAKAVTGLLLAAVSRAGMWQVIEPGAVRSAEAENEAEVAVGAGKLATAAKADAAFVVQVSRFRERVGGDYGVSEPASVALRILLVPAGRSAPVWRADYAFTQEPLSYNLWNFWQVQRGGVKWLTAAEIAKIGIDEAIARLSGKPVSG